MRERNTESDRQRLRQIDKVKEVILTYRYVGKVPQMPFLNGPTTASFLFNFILFRHKLYSKTVSRLQ